MFDAVRSFAASHRDASELVKEAEKFALRLPLVGRIAVPPPDQLAFFGVLGGLAALGAIEWPVAVAIGVGQIVVARHFTDTSPTSDRQRLAAPPQAPANRTPAKKAVRKPPAKKAATGKTTGKKAGTRARRS